MQPKDYQKSPRRRHVHFATAADHAAAENDSIVPPPMKELTLTMINDVWYTEEEITNFKRTAKRIVCTGRIPEGDSVSGLERYQDIQRSKYKRSALYYILQAQQSSRNPEFIRAVSKRCTAWARHVAFNQGFAQYCQVYGDPLDTLLLEDLECFENENNKRGLEDEPLPLSKRQKPMPSDAPLPVAHAM